MIFKGRKANHVPPGASFLYLQSRSMSSLCGSVPRPPGSGEHLSSLFSRLQVLTWLPGLSLMDCRELRAASHPGASQWTCITGSGAQRIVDTGAALYLEAPQPLRIPESQGPPPVPAWNRAGVHIFAPLTETGELTPAPVHRPQAGPKTAVGRNRNWWFLKEHEFKT